MKTTSNTLAKSFAWPRLNIYSLGSFAYAYNPTSRRWEVYSLDDTGSIDDLLTDCATKEAARDEIGLRGARAAVRENIAYFAGSVAQ